MPRGRVKWIASLQDPLDQGAATPSFPYELFRPIMQRADVLDALGSDSQTIEAELGRSTFDALVEVIWEFNCFPRLFSTHTLTWLDQGQTIPGEFAWAAHRAHCQFCILPRDQEVPDLETAQKIVWELHGATLDCLRQQRLTPPEGTLVFLAPIVMRFGTKAQPFPIMGFGVHATVDGYAGRPEQARVRCGRALSLFAEVLRAARA